MDRYREELGARNRGRAAALWTALLPTPDSADGPP